MKYTQVADAYINARLNGKFDDVSVSSREEVIKAIRDGKLIERLLEEIEIRYCTITSIVSARTFKHATASYKAGVRKGFRILFTQN